MTTCHTLAPLDQIAQRALSTRETLQSTYLMAKDCISRGVPGDFVECGVFAGSQVAAMALAIMESDSQRKVHLFDSFEGIPQAGEHDGEFLSAGHKAGLSACSMADVKKHMTEWGIDPNVLVYHPGLFCNSVLQFSQRIALLRLDGDLYDSTKIVMECLYPLITPGGWCIVDDFGLSGCHKAVLDYMGAGFPPVYWQAV